MMPDDVVKSAAIVIGEKILRRLFKGDVVEIPLKSEDGVTDGIAFYFQERVRKWISAHPVSPLESRAQCGGCNRHNKVYIMGPTVSEFSGSIIGIRCSYCKREKWVHLAQWVGLKGEASMIATPLGNETIHPEV